MKKLFLLGAMVCALGMMLAVTSCSSKDDIFSGVWVATDPELMGMTIDFIDENQATINLAMLGWEITTPIRISNDSIYQAEEGSSDFELWYTIKSINGDTLTLLQKDGKEDVYVRTGTSKNAKREKNIDKSKYQSGIIGEWEFTERKDDGKWVNSHAVDRILDNFELKFLEWHIAFSKDGSGYLSLDNNVLPFEWKMPVENGKIIIQSSDFVGTMITIQSMSKNSMQLEIDNDTYKLSRIM